MDRTRSSRLRFQGSRIGAALAFGALALTGCNSLAAALLTPALDREAATLRPGDFRLDTAHAALLFRINHLGFADYVGRFDRFEASLSGDPADPGSAEVEAIIDIASLNVANRDFEAQLTGRDWLDAANHPQAIFRSRSVRLTGPASAEVAGDLTLRGRTRPITLDVRFNGSAYDRLRGADVAGFSASAEINRSEFGIDRYSGLITDIVRFEIEAEFIRNGPG
ncbi:YceI family protein [Hyphomonas sp.]|uniref:YceI family protein n=1 Tax=Hyphomonas sp. TaxID=87 RepID=UPI003918A73D